MAPEQAAGQTRQLTTAVDVYGLGAIDRALAEFGLSWDARPASSAAD